MADDLFNYIEELKTKMTSDLEDTKAYESMDKSGFLDQYFFANGKISKKGKEYVAKIKEFKEKALEVLGERELADVVSERFKTDDVKDKEGVKKSWLSYNYEGFPLIASLTKMTQIQSDVKTTESDALSALLQGELSKAVSMTN
jgi:gliding motility-associated protein GldM